MVVIKIYEKLFLHLLPFLSFYIYFITISILSLHRIMRCLVIERVYLYIFIYNQVTPPRVGSRPTRSTRPRIRHQIY